MTVLEATGAMAMSEKHQPSPRAVILWKEVRDVAPLLSGCVALVIALEFCDDSLRDMEDAGSFLKIPILGSIPILGNAFRRKIKTKSKTELMIFLTPHVVRGASELGEMTRIERGQAEVAKEVFSDKLLEKYVGTFDEAPQE